MPKLAIALTIMIGLLAGETLAHDGRGGFGGAPRSGSSAGGQRSSDFGVHGFGGASGESGSHGFGVIGRPGGTQAPNPNFIAPNPNVIVPSPNVNEWHRGGQHFEGRHHRHTSPGFAIEAPYAQPNFYYWPYYTMPPSYSSPTVIVPSVPPAYVEQGTVPSEQPRDPNSWNYCPDPAGYYPYVQNCPGGWLTVDPQPLNQQPGYWYYCSDPPGYYPYVRECSKAWQNVVP